MVLYENHHTFFCQGDACGNAPSNSAEFDGVFPAAALCDQSADWSLARQEGFFARRMSLQKIFALENSPKISDLAGLPFHFTSSAEVNSACGKVLLRKTLVRATWRGCVDLPKDT